MVKELRAQIRLKNNRLISLREDLGMTQKAAAEAIGVSIGALMELECLKSSPMCKGATGEWRDVSRKIADFHGVAPSWIWPEAVQKIVKAHAIEKRLDVEDLARLAPAHEDGDSVTKALRSAMATLTPREEKALRLRFGLGDGREHTREEIAKEIGGVSTARALQVECKAMRKLRSPEVIGGIKESVGRIDIAPCTIVVTPLVAGDTCRWVWNVISHAGERIGHGVSDRVLDAESEANAWAKSSHIKVSGRAALSLGDKRLVVLRKLADEAGIEWEWVDDVRAHSICPFHPRWLPSVPIHMDLRSNRFWCNSGTRQNHYGTIEDLYRATKDAERRIGHRGTGAAL